jgi:hypothetical protein
MSLFTSIARALARSPIVLNEDESSSSSSNASSGAEGVAPVSTQVAAKLNQQILSVYGEFLSEDGRAVDYTGMAQVKQKSMINCKLQSMQRTFCLFVCLFV